MIDISKVRCGSVLRPKPVEVHFVYPDEEKVLVVVDSYQLWLPADAFDEIVTQPWAVGDKFRLPGLDALFEITSIRDNRVLCWVKYPSGAISGAFYSLDALKDAIPVI